MCFVISVDHKEAMIASKDIKCFKRLRLKDGKLTSPCFFFTWKANQLRYSRLGKNDRIINEGLHSHSSLGAAITHQSGSHVIAEFIIPKGAKYYYNSYEAEYVSNRIYWTGRVYRTDRWVPFNGKITEKMRYIKLKFE